MVEQEKRESDAKNGRSIINGQRFELMLNIIISGGHNVT